MLTNTDTRQSKLYIGMAGLAALGLLTACTADEAGDQQPGDQEVETIEPDDTQQGTTDGGQQGTTNDDATGQTDDPEALGGDPVFDVVSAVEAEYDGGFIVDIDRDDDGDLQYEVDVVVDNELHELDVTADGEISEDDRDGDDDKIAKAEQATVTVTAALNEAFNAHPEATFEQIELDEDAGDLRWEIELEAAEGSEVDLEIPAT